MREGIEPFRRLRYLHQLQHLQGKSPSVGGGCVAMSEDRLDHLAADGEAGVEARHRVLEDHADHGSAEPAKLLARQTEDGLALDGDVARGDRQPLVEQAETRQRCDALAGAALTDEADRLAGPNGQTNVGHQRLDEPAATRDADAHVVQDQCLAWRALIAPARRTRMDFGLDHHADPPVMPDAARGGRGGRGRHPRLC